METYLGEARERRRKKTLCSLSFQRFRNLGHEAAVRKSLLYIARSRSKQESRCLYHYHRELLEVIGTDGRATGRAVIRFLDGWEAHSYQES